MDCEILKGKEVLTGILDSLKGLVSANQEIALFDYGNVLVQKDYMKYDTVRIISGGSNFFGEYVGKGMLTATVQGNKTF